MGAYESIKDLADKHSLQLGSQIAKRVTEMEQDDNSHYLLYKVLGIAEEEGRLIDVYQNKGRFLYKYAGAFLEDAAALCIKLKYPDAVKTRIANTQSSRPKTFEIDALNGQDAIEIKWRDATTDGDHIAKEHARVLNIKEAGYHPIRVMFYAPNRAQAIKIQQKIKTIYTEMGGECHFAADSWAFIEQYTGIDLLEILEMIGSEKTGG
ncbi:ApaLI family restriction endonuclease [Rhodococcus sp. NPDC078407]|uniref:ApaLI family restriction endonuclease n=1 Tax=Rhodococcus sp. NPDC078407 TaxID=3364509 RepID=UPI0037C6253B